MESVILHKYLKGGCKKGQDKRKCSQVAPGQVSISLEKETCHQAQEQAAQATGGTIVFTSVQNANLNSKSILWCLGCGLEGNMVMLG